MKRILIIIFTVSMMSIGFCNAQESGKVNTSPNTSSVTAVVDHNNTPHTVTLKKVKEYCNTRHRSGRSLA